MLSKNPGIVEEGNYGVYIWRDARGRAVVNEDFEYLLVPSKRGDIRKIAMLKKAVESFGITDGEAEFCAGSRPISHEEWEVQKERQEEGYVPDPYDLGSLIDDLNYQKAMDSGEFDR